MPLEPYVPQSSMTAAMEATATRLDENGAAAAAAEIAAADASSAASGAQAAAESAASTATLALGAGSRYAPTAYYATQSTNDLLAGGFLTLYWVWSCPIVIPRAMTIDRIAVEVTTAGSGSTVRLGLYEYADLATEETALIVDGGTVDTSTTGIKEATVSVAVAAAPILAVAVWQGGTSPQIRCQRGAYGPSASATQAINTPAGYGLNTVALPTGALPASLVVGPSSTSYAPRIVVRGTAS